jgi:hypothetical protein
MIKTDFEGACKMASTSLPEGWTIEIQLEKGVNMLGLFPPNGARIDFDTTGMTMASQMLKAIALAKTSETATQGTMGGALKADLCSKGQV